MSLTQNVIPHEELSAGWYLFPHPNGAERLLWLERGNEFWTVALSPAYAKAGQFYATLADVALHDAGPKPVETGPHAASMSAWEASAICL